MASSASNLAGVIVHGIEPQTIGTVIDLRKNIEAPVKIEDKLGYLSNPELLRHIPADEVIGIGPGGEEYTKGPDLPMLGDDLDPLVAAVVAQPPLQPGLVIGRELAKTLHVYVGDEVTLVSPLGDLGPDGSAAQDAEVPHRGDLLQRDVRVRRDPRVHDDRRGPELLRDAGGDQRHRRAGGERRERRPADACRDRGRRARGGRRHPEERRDGQREGRREPAGQAREREAQDGRCRDHPMGRRGSRGPRASGARLARDEQESLQRPASWRGSRRFSSCRSRSSWRASASSARSC